MDGAGIGRGADLGGRDLQEQAVAGLQDARHRGVGHPGGQRSQAPALEAQQRGLQDSYDLLTDREKEILQLLAEGKSNKEVASQLNVSLNTVETHRTKLMQKLDLHSAAEIVLYAVRKKIIS